MSDALGTPCEEAMARVWAFLDGELDQEGMAGVERHLDVCARCFPAFDFHRAFAGLLRAHGQQRIPPELRRRIFLALLQERGST